MRVLKWSALALGVLLLCAVLFVLFGLNTLRGPISRAVTNATGRELLIDGDLKPSWSWVHPRFLARKVTFANPSWAKEKYLLQADSIDFTVSVMPLLTGRIVVHEVHLQHPVVALELDAEGRKSWILKEKDRDAKEESRIFIHRLTLDQGRLTYNDALRDISLTTDLQTDADGIAFKAQGKFSGQPLVASGHGGPVLALRQAEEAYPLKVDAKVGETSASIDGRITELVGLSGIDMQVKLSGRSMEDLYDIIGVALPNTSPYSTAGHLVREDSVIRYENFTGKVGESDLAGTLQVDTASRPPMMQGELHSKVLNLADLGPVVGTQQPSKTGTLPDAPFNTERWHSVNADVRIQAGSIRRPEQLPIEKLATRIRMQDAVLALDPLEFGVAGGKLVGPIRLDGRSDTIKADAKIRVDKLQLAKLFPTLKVTKASVGDLSGAVDLQGSGNTVARMLGSANGKIGVYMNGGQVSELIMQAAALDLWGLARVSIKGDEQIPIRCIVGDFGLKDGLMQTNALVFDTRVVNIGGSGTINLKNEALDLTLMPEPKDKSFASLNSPLYVRGTFKAPKVAPDVGKLAAKGAGALVMGIINPLLAVIPLIHEGPGTDSQCGQLIAEATAKTKQAKAAADRSASSQAGSAAPATSSGQSASSGATAPRPRAKSAR
jgi:uncharacterized protein involved in outer membrane biogenesis